jgi:hypothetical protein
MSLALADIDGNGTLDLYIANYRTVSMNDQPNTRFSFRVVDNKPVVSTVNGRPITEPDLIHRYNFKLNFNNGQATFSYDENGEPDAVFLNDGRGHFTPLSFTKGAFLDERGSPLSNHHSIGDFP